MKTLILIDYTVLVTIMIAIVVVIVGEFCGGLWLRPLSQDLFSVRVPIPSDRWWVGEEALPADSKIKKREILD